MARRPRGAHIALLTVADRAQLVRMDRASQAVEVRYRWRLRLLFALLLAFIVALALISSRAIHARVVSNRNLQRSDRVLGELASLESAVAIQIAYGQPPTSGDPPPPAAGQIAARARIARGLDGLRGLLGHDSPALALLAVLRGDLATSQRARDGAARLRADLDSLDLLIRSEHRGLRLRDQASDRESDVVSDATIGALFVLVLLSYVMVSGEFRRRQRVIESLRASEALLLANFEQSGVGIAHIGRDRRILRANRRLGAMLGARPQDLTGVSVLELAYPGGGGDRLAAERERIFSGQLEYAVGVHRYVRRDGTVFWAQVTISVARSWGGIAQYEIAVFEDVTRERLARSQAGRLRVALDMSFDAVYVVSHPDMTILDSNDAACRMLGYAREELIGADARTILSDGVQACAALASDDKAGEGAPGHSTRESMHRRKDGVLIPVEIQSGQVAIRGARYVVCVVRDITERKCVERALAFEHAVTRCIAGLALGESDSRINALIRTICESEGSEAGFYLSLDEGAEMLRGRECWCAPGLAGTEAMQELTCVPGGGIGGVTWETGEPCWVADLRAERCGAAGERLIAAGLRSAFTFPVLAEGQVLGVIVIFGRGARAPDRHLIEAARSAGAQIGQFLERSQARQRLAYMAQFDEVTGLPNRSLFRDRIEQVLAQGRRHQTQFGLLFLDLDDFKRINDTLGHATGDELLRQVAGRLVACMRAGDTVARLGGDEFAFVLSDLDSPEGASAVAQQLLDALKAPFALAGREVYVSASIGITVQPPDGGDAETLLRNADTAMYRAKHGGRNGFRFFAAEMDIEAKRRLELEKDLRGAIERAEFELYYQPKCEVSGNRITGAEALLRWRRRDGTLVPPADFIPILEDTGLIAEVGDWVLCEACRQHTAWHLAGLGRVPIAVNVSQRQFVGGTLIERVSAALATGDCAARFLEIEITESMVMHDVEVTVQTLQGLRAAGVRIAVDDFGTGYSSFAYLRRLPIDVLKIDRSFIKDVNGNANDATITTAIIGMARNLGYRLVAEGVETPLQRQFLEANGCHEIQGYLLSRPLPAAEFARWLAAHEASPQPPADRAGSTT